MTLRELAAQSEAQLLAGRHPERARLDAETLLLHLTRRNRAWLLAHRDDDAGGELQAEFRLQIERRVAGEPLQYITGNAEFFGLNFAVAQGVLIPRPETEHLVEEVMRLAVTFNRPRIADIGTGSGAIAVALAHALPEARLTATDESYRALRIAQRNAEQNQVAKRIAFLEGDLLAPLKGKIFDIIASNPPYVPLADRDSLSVEVREYEPHSALFAGEDGLAIYRRLIPEAHKFLAAAGWLAMEIGYGQQAAIDALLRASRYREIHFVPDYQGIPRVACGRPR